MTRLELIASTNPRTGAEVGTLRGDFAAELLTIPTLETLYVIDAWQHFPGEYEKDPANVDQGGHDERERYVRQRFHNEARIIIQKGDSLGISKFHAKDSLDFAFIDANHTYTAVFDDLTAWQRVTNTLYVHDYREDESARAMGFDVVQAVADFNLINGWIVDAVTDEEWPTARLICP